MRYGIFSDVHGNLEALKAVLKAYESENIDEYICLGDMVGYGANPRECLALVRDTCSHVIAGNHDFAAVGKTDVTYFNSNARAAVEWTARQLTEEDKAYILSLDIMVVKTDAIFVHASLDEPDKWNYILDPITVYKNFILLDRPLCFIGHSHIPCVFLDEERVEFVSRREISHTFKSGDRYIINVGSVGQPRDNDPMSSFCIYDAVAREISIKRVPYDIDNAQRKILEAGLPEILALRLVHGE